MGGKSAFVAVDEGWPFHVPTGLRVRKIEGKEEGGKVVEYEYVRNAEYDLAQMAFERGVATYDPDVIVNLARRNPWHVDTLLQLAEIFVHSNQLAEAASIIEQALYGLEVAWPASLDVGNPRTRIRYRNRANRGLFLVLFKHIANLSRKGCQGTAFEVCKLLVGLDIEADPVGGLLMLDYYALRAKEYDAVHALYTALEFKNVSRLPNWAYSLALAKFHLAQGSDGAGSSGGTTEADDALKAAFTLFPGVLLGLADSLSWSLNPHPTFASAPTSVSLQVLEALYVERAQSLFKSAHVVAWITRVASEWAASSPSSERAVQMDADFAGNPPAPICRHVVLAGYDSVLGLLPSSLLEGGVRTYNPFPPAGEVDVEAGNTAGGAGGGYMGGINESLLNAGGMGLQLLQSLLPWQLIGQGGGGGGGGGAGAGEELDEAGIADLVQQILQGQMALPEVQAMLQGGGGDGEVGDYEYEYDQ